MARAESRRDALSQFEVNVARCAEVVLSRWEIQVIKLRAESPQPPTCPSKTTVVASVGCVLERPFEGFVVRKVLSRGRGRA